MTIRLDPSADAHLDAALHRVMEHLGQDIAADAQATVRVNTGRLKSSIVAEVEGLTLRVSTDVDYWRHVEYGTGPHIIRPNTKKALYWEGAAHPVAMVNHPGTPAFPFLRPALLKPRELR
ncbi:HK97 gp10 family phage protein [Kitasatospora sp. NPDC057223]|uniref:HK97 gp10 family phage protein n=1 Tax=Kitasatospora sp. NPDC057223 TaxID=3346055 RepID=UPI0036408486